MGLRKQGLIKVISRYNYNYLTYKILLPGFRVLLQLYFSLCFETHSNSSIARSARGCPHPAGASATLGFLSAATDEKRRSTNAKTEFPELNLKFSWFRKQPRLHHGRPAPHGNSRETTGARIYDFAFRELLFGVSGNVNFI